MTRIFEFRWNNKNLPYFRTLENYALSERKLAFGKNFSLEITDDMVCGGSERDGKWEMCATQERGVRKCEACKKREGMSAMQYCDGFNTAMFGADELEALHQPHYLYFALFDKNLIKIGVSSLQRGFLRQIEQGAHFSLIVAEGMWGVPARQMETVIRRTGVVDKIQSSQKKDFVFPHLTEAEGKKILLELAAEKMPIVTAYRADFSQFLLDEPVFKNWSSCYHLDEAAAVEKPLQEVTLEKGESLSGTLIAAKGPFLVFETDTERILIEGKKLKGYEVSFSDRPVGLKKNAGFQGAMF